MPKKKSVDEAAASLTPQTKSPEYLPEEIVYRQELIKKMISSKNARDASHREFNDMDYRNYYDSNLRAANSYIPPKKNQEDTRVVTGTTEEKGNTLLSAILNYNLEPNVIAFDKNDMEVDELGRTMQDLIKKSREIDEYDVKRMLIYKELLDQGTCFVEEQWVDERRIEKKLKDINWYDGIQVAKIDWTEKEVKGFCGAQARLIAGDKVYLGNIKEFEIKKQPFLFTVDIMSYSEAEAIYKNWDRFEFVPKKIVRSEPHDNSTYRDWTLEAQEENFVEVIKYQDRFNNEFMIMLNGVMMLPIKFPLEAVSPSGSYTIAKGDVYPISNFFAYSKSIPAKTKVDQEVLDEMMKLIILKTRKSYKPSLANNTGKVLSRRIFNPGNIENQINPDQLKEIGNNNGVTQSEFSAFEFIKRIVDEKSVSPAFMGDQTSGRQTATEILELKKQQMMKLGLVIYGIISLERQLSWLRTYNILQNWTKAQDTKISEITGEMEDIFKTVTVDTELEDTQQGKKIIQFSPDAANYTPDQIMEEENQLSQTMRQPVRKVYVHPDVSKMKYFWYITISPTEKDTSDLQRILFKQDVADGMQLFGPQTLNFPYLMKRFAVLSKQDPEKFFVKNAPAQPTEAQLGGGDNGGLGAQLNRGVGTAPMGGQ
jgi:hypothetical protein